MTAGLKAGSISGEGSTSIKREAWLCGGSNTGYAVFLIQFLPLLQTLV